MLLLVTPDSAFTALVPWLLLLATVLFIAGPRLLILRRPNSSSKRLTEFLALTAVCAYGGYFNGGLGIILLATLATLGYTNINLMNAIKVVVSTLLTLFAIMTYSLGGIVIWQKALPMMIAATVGGYFAAALAQRIPPRHVRMLVVTTGLVMTSGFFVRNHL